MMFRAKAVIVRDVNEIRIVFYNHETIYVRDDTARWHIFHRWVAPRGSYNRGWRQFRHMLLYEKNITIEHCYRLAFRHEISSQIALSGPDLSKVIIEERL